MATHIDLQIDQEMLERAIANLELENPPAFVLNGTRDDVNVLGTFEARRNLVTINVHRPGFGATALAVLTKGVKHTILHELRHAWQREKLSPEELTLWKQGRYRDRREERDANDWAARNERSYPGLVKIVRKKSGKSGFARFAAAERGSRA